MAYDTGANEVVDGLKEMPAAADSELYVLSAMLGSNTILQNCLVALKPFDFYQPRNRVVFEAMTDMFNKNLPIDPVSLADYLNTSDQLERAGGASHIVELTGNPIALSTWEHHVDILHRQSTLRSLISASAEVAAMAYDAPSDTKEIVDKAESLIMGVTSRSVGSTFSTLETVMSDLYDELGEMCQNRDDALGVMTGYPSLDAQLLGLRPGQMVVVGARPGVGKTSFALNFAFNAATSGAAVAFFSLEMSSTEIGQRLLSANANINLMDIRSGRIKDDQWPRIMQATSDLSSLDITIDDTPGTTVTEIRAKARRMLNGKQNGIVIIDYLQLLSPPSGQRRSDSRATEVSEMSRGIKIMAKDLGVPVVALSQLNRGVEQRAGKYGKRPQLSDLRESGAIEQDADIVILLDRSMTEEEAEQEGRPDNGITQLILAKNRSGPLGIVDLTFLAGSTKFVEVDNFHDDY